LAAGRWASSKPGASTWSVSGSVRRSGTEMKKPRPLGCKGWGFWPGRSGARRRPGCCAVYLSGPDRPYPRSDRRSPCWTARPVG
jgi:hypothetical protein